MSLTTLELFKTYAGISGANQDSLITALIPQVSSQIERYLRRTLESTTYKVWLDGSGAPVLRLTQYPITALYQVSIGSRSVASISNTSGSVVHASVSFDGTNLVLTEISTAGDEKMTELAVATYKTIGTLLTAINNTAGWVCTLQSSDYGTLTSTFLRPLYGLGAVNPSSADLVVPDGPVPVKIVYEDMIEIINSEQFPNWDIFPQNQQPNRMSAVQPGTTPPTFSYGFPPGTCNIFAWFKAGYILPTDDADGNLPPGLVLLVHEVMQDVISSTKVNSNLQSERIGDYSYTLRATDKGAVASAIENRKKELNQFRRVSI